jgi:hypothetical protein
MALARADEFCGADRRMQACAVSLLLAPASCDLTALAADDACAARLVEAAAAPAHMVAGLDRTGAAVGGSDRTAVYRFVAAAAGAKYCLALAHSNAGVVANVGAAEMFARDRSAAFEENMESAIQWFPRLHAALGVSMPEAPAVARLYTLVAGMPASTKSPLTVKGLHALEFQVSRVPGQADFKTVCAAFHETAESAAALKSGFTVLRPLLEDPAYKALVDAGKGVDAKALGPRSVTRAAGPAYALRRPRDKSRQWPAPLEGSGITGTRLRPPYTSPGPRARGLRAAKENPTVGRCGTQHPLKRQVVGGWVVQRKQCCARGAGGRARSERWLLCSLRKLWEREWAAMLAAPFRRRPRLMRLRSECARVRLCTSA